MNLLLDLERNEYISRTNVRILEQYCHRWGVSPYHALLETHVMTEHDLADAIGESYSIERVYSFDRNEVDLDVLAKISYSEALQFSCVTPNRDEKGSYLVYIADPTNVKLGDFLDKNLVAYKLVVVDLTLLKRSIEEAYPLELQLTKLSMIRGEND